jgi:glucosamine-6-phosphate deaminase
MNIHVHPDSDALTQAAADWLVQRLVDPQTRNLMVAGGNTPLPLYRDIATRGLDLTHLRVFPLDEYVGVPPDDPRTCSNLLRTEVVDAWRIPAAQYFPLSSQESDAEERIQEHETRIADAGGLDLIVLGLGQNGHLGFNEPGSPPDSRGRMVRLEPSSIEANRRWFGGDHAPSQGATVGLRTILSARRALILAHGKAKAAAVTAMVRGKVGIDCPASFLQGHPETHVYLDAAAAGEFTDQGF